MQVFVTTLYHSKLLNIQACILEHTAMPTGFIDVTWFSVVGQKFMAAPELAMPNRALPSDI